MSVPVKTVKTRLHRALALLRGKLDQRYDRRSAWIVALAPMTEKPTPSLLFAYLNTTAMTTALKVTAIGLAAISIYVLLPERDARPPSSSSEPLDTNNSSLKPEGVAIGERRNHIGTEPQRTVVPQDEPAADLTGQSFKFHLYGSVLDPFGVGLSRVRVRFWSNASAAHAGIEGSTDAISDAGGRFDLRFRVGPGFARFGGTVNCDDPHYATVLEGRIEGARGVTADLEEEHVIVVAPKILLAGTVVDDLGRPVPKATVRFRMPADLRSRFTRVLDRSAIPGWNTTTDTDGKFLLEDVPALDGAAVIARRTGIGNGEIDAPVTTDRELLIVLPDEITDGEATVAGLVLDPEGSPVADAVVSLDDESTRSDIDGTFRLRIATQTERARRLVAVKEGYLPAVHEPERSVAGEEWWPKFVELRMGSAPFSISGLAIGIDGEPLSGAEVWTDDPSFLVESHNDYLTLEKVMRGDDDARWSHVSADAEGRFDLGGLLERDYTVCVMDPKSMLVAKVKAVPAGTRGLEVRLSAGDLWEEIAGRVVDRHGNPVPEVRVQLATFVQVVVSPHGGVSKTGYRNFSRNSIGTKTDSEGRFRLEGVPRAGTFLFVSGNSILQSMFEIDEGIQDPSQLEVEILWRCHVQLEIVDTVRGVASFGFLAEDGRPVSFQIIAGRSTSIRQTGEFSNGRSAVVTVPETVTTVVLYDEGGRELKRMPVTPLPGQLTTIGV